MKILIADDDGAMRTMLGVMLSRWGYDFCEASDGTQAWELLEAENSQIQITILDWNMPGLDGLEICRRLSERKNRSYILMVTGKGTDADVVEGLMAGANDFLPKPFTPELLHLRLLIATGIVEKQKALTERVIELEGGIAERQEVDRLLTGMMESWQGVSDLLFVSRKYPQVEAFGKLKAAPVVGWNDILTPERTKQLAQFFINGNEGIRSDFESNGSCDCSYAIENVARFRVNIYGSSRKFCHRSVFGDSIM